MLSDRGEKLDNVLGHMSSLLDLRPPRHYDKVHLGINAGQKHEELGRSSPQGSHLLFLKNRGFEKIPAHSMAEASANVEAYGDTPLSSTLDPENRNSLRSLPRYRPTRGRCLARFVVKTATGMPGDDSEAFHLRLSNPCANDARFGVVQALPLAPLFRVLHTTYILVHRGSNKQKGNGGVLHTIADVILIVCQGLVPHGWHVTPGSFAGVRGSAAWCVSGDTGNVPPSKFLPEPSSQDFGQLRSWVTPRKELLYHSASHGGT
ncbi:hypothetical protein F5141DRAFT_1063413 [Pisolithus sp. B1]|nr:hypothetical protein F5141DRAFT_1063413 [Pisolithus sp. B1]